MFAPRRMSSWPTSRRSRGRGLTIIFAAVAAIALPGIPAARAVPSDQACFDANTSVALSGRLSMIRIPAIASPPHAAVTYARLVLDRPLCLRDPYETDRDILSVAIEPAPSSPPDQHATVAVTVSGHLIFNGSADHPPELAVLFVTVPVSQDGLASRHP